MVLSRQSIKAVSLQSFFGCRALLDGSIAEMKKGEKAQVVPLVGRLRYRGAPPRFLQAPPRALKWSCSISTSRKNRSCGRRPPYSLIQGKREPWSVRGPIWQSRNCETGPADGKQQAPIGVWLPGLSRRSAPERKDSRKIRDPGEERPPCRDKQTRAPDVSDCRGDNQHGECVVHLISHTCLEDPQHFR